MIDCEALCWGTFVCSASTLALLFLVFLIAAFKQPEQPPIVNVTIQKEDRKLRRHIYDVIDGLSEMIDLLNAQKQKRPDLANVYNEVIDWVEIDRDRLANLLEDSDED